MTTERDDAPRRAPLPGPRSMHQVLILLAAFLLGGESSLVERVDDALDGRPGAEEALATAGRIDAAHDRNAALIVETRGALVAALQRHDLTQVELRAVLERGAHAAESLQSELIELRFQLRAQLEADEWTTVFEDDADE